MKQEFTIPVTYSRKTHYLKCVLEYTSVQLFRIRVYGNKSTLLLETNYPFIKTAKSKKGITWKIREGSLDASEGKDARLLMDIFRELERWLQEQYPSY